MIPTTNFSGRSMIALLLCSSILFSSTTITTTDAFTLITFDVDGTLVQGSGKAADTSAHSRSFSHAVGSVFSNGSNNSNNNNAVVVPVAPVADALPQHLYHGSTDGLILLRLAKATLGMEPTTAFPQLDMLMQSMYQYMADLCDEEVARGITPLPGVLNTLDQLATMKDRVMCGLVTGNVEGIARRKMHAVGVYQTGALAPPSPDQRKWPGTEDIGFLGGFGSDYCSGNIDDLIYNHLDRSQQIEIAVNRCRQILDSQGHELRRVVHVGDAPSDVLAAKAYADRMSDSSGICVGMVATATGSYGADELQALAGPSVPGKWECVVLKDGISDPTFLKACGVRPRKV